MTDPDAPDPDSVALDRLRRVLDTPDTAWLLQRMRIRLEQTGELSGAIVRQQATAAERAAVARLLGRPVRAGQSASVALEHLDAVLRRSVWPDGAVSAVVALTGRYVPPEERRDRRRAWHAASGTLSALAARHPQAAQWLDQAARRGALKRVAASPEVAQALAAQLAALADALPSEGEVLGVLAVRLFGDAHALDARAALGALTTGLAAAIGGVSVGADAQGRREAWASVGVVVDELSSSVISLGLPGGDSSPTAKALAVLAPSGQPVVLTYRQLATDSVGDVPATVFVCENPAVVAAAADRLGPASAPVVCLGGQPGAAAMRLLSQLVEGGARLHYHGDFDAGGMSIARTLARQVPWQPWRYAAVDYRDGLDQAVGLLGGFTGTVGPTIWSPELEALLDERRLRLEEESVLDLLIGDLAGGFESGR